MDPAGGRLARMGQVIDCGARGFPSYLQAGLSFIEKSMRGVDC